MSAATPLHGLRVLELATGLAGSFATAILGDLGAEVVKLEAPPAEESPDGTQAQRRAFDRNKRSVVLDVNESEGRAAAVVLLGWCDVVVDECTDDELRDLGLPAAAFDGCLHASVTGYGPQPPPGLCPDDLLIEALSGCMDLTGEAGGPPFRSGIQLADLAAGVYGALGILGSVAGGASAGRIEVAKIDVAVALLSYMAVGYFADGESPTRVGTGHSTIFPYNAFRASDGEVVVAPFTQRFWRNFAAATGRSDLTAVDDFASFARRLRQKEALLAIFEPIMLQKPVAEWVDTFAEHDVPSGPVLTVGEALELNQTRERGLTPAMSEAGGRTERVAGSPFRFAATDGTTWHPTLHAAPAVGRDTTEVLAEAAASRTGASPQPPAPRSSGGGPLEGLRVLDFTRMFAGPCAAQVFADLGAEVLKIEEPRIGDPTRRNLPFWGDESAYFMSLNRGKRSVCLDLKDPTGLAVARQLAETADVVLENYRPGVMGRLGLDYDTVSAVNPRIVYGSLSGFGATGPLRDKISFDLVNQAMAGMIDVTGAPGERPVRVGVPIGDMFGGLYLATAMLAGLRAREITGSGSWVDLSLHDVLITLLGDLAQRYFDTGRSPGRTASRDRDSGPAGCFQARDGWLVLQALDDASWKGLIGVTGLAGLMPELHDASGVERKAREEDIESVLQEWLGRQSVDEAVALLTYAGVPAAPVLSLAGALGSELVRNRHIVYDVEQPGVGPARNLASPIVLDGSRCGLGRVSPALGADTAPVLHGLGYGDDQLAQLAEQGVVRCTG